jgi:hypothetical protein
MKDLKYWIWFAIAVMCLVSWPILWLAIPLALVVLFVFVAVVCMLPSMEEPAAGRRDYRKKAPAPRPGWVIPSSAPVPESVRNTLALRSSISESTRRFNAEQLEALEAEEAEQAARS